MTPPDYDKQLTALAAFIKRAEGIDPTLPSIRSEFSVAINVCSKCGREVATARLSPSPSIAKRRLCLLCARGAYRKTEAAKRQRGGL